MQWAWEGCSARQHSWLLSRWSHLLAAVHVTTCSQWLEEGKELVRERYTYKRGGGMERETGKMTRMDKEEGRGKRGKREARRRKERREGGGREGGEREEIERE